MLRHIEEAFDKTKFISITAALLRHGVHAVMTEWKNKMLNQKVIRLKADAIEQALVAKGCPQGGIFSPLP